MPQRVAQGIDTIVKVVGVGGALLTYLAIAPRFIGLTPALNIFNSFLLGVTLLVLWLLHLDLESMDNSESEEADDTESGSDMEDIRTDGGIRLSPHLRELREESPEGGGALAGLIAGGALGLLGGPAGVVLGGLAGGILGNEAEYQQIVDRYREELGTTAKNALFRDGVHAPRPYTVENISHRSTDDTYAVLIEDSTGNQHRIRLDLDEETYVYEEG